MGNKYFYGAVLVESDSAEPVAPKPAEDMAITDVQTLIVQNPQMNAASFYNLLKSKGFKIIGPEAAVVTEAVVSQPQLDRAKESASLGSTYFNFKFVESANGGDQGDERYQNRFRVILIQEGLGNSKDGYYYTKEALKSAVPVFEGRKMYADHPDKMEEQTRPERSVRDVFGHFEKVDYVEAEDGTAQLQADLVVLPDQGSDWVRARMQHAIGYAKKYPDKEFIGLSINASGNAEPVDAAKFLNEGNVVQSALGKLKEAIAEGLTEVKVVNTIDSAVSCDLVTEAGARGKVVELLEADKMDKKHKEKHEEKQHHEAMPGEEQKDAPAAHGDEEQDKQLIMDMMKKHGLVKDGEAASEESMKAAHNYHQAYKAAGHDTQEAAHRACEAMKCAGEAQKMHQADQVEADAKKKDEEECKKEAHKESAEVLKLKGENAKLAEKLAAIETASYLDKKLAESRLPMSVTKKFKESAKNLKNAKDVDERFNLFMEGYRAVGGEAGALDSFVMVEKEQSAADAGVSSLDDCVEE